MPLIDLFLQLQDEAWWLHTVFSCPLHAEASVSALHYAGMTFLVENGILIPGNPTGARTSRARPNLLVRRLVEASPRRLQFAGPLLSGQLPRLPCDTGSQNAGHSTHQPEGGIQDHRSFSRSVRPSLPTLRTGWTWLMKAGLAMSTSSGTTSHLWNQDKHWVH